MFVGNVWLPFRGFRNSYITNRDNKESLLRLTKKELCGLSITSVPTNESSRCRPGTSDDLLVQRRPNHGDDRTIEI